MLLRLPPAGGRDLACAEHTTLQRGGLAAVDENKGTFLPRRSLRDTLRLVPQTTHPNELVLV